MLYLWTYKGEWYPSQGQEKLACSTLSRYASICSSCPSRSFFFLSASRARSLRFAAMSSLARASSFAMRSSTC